jgi:dihydroxy-acid dehydratase
VTDAPNRRSRTITAGVARSPNRAMLRAVGFTDRDFDKPIVGIASGASTMNPCNAGLGPLAARAEAAVREAGAMPQTFGFPTVTDGISMGTEGMKYSLVSREVICDAIETAAQSQFMDGVLCLGGCDKNMPGSLMALLRMNVPGIFCYGGYCAGKPALRRHSYCCYCYFHKRYNSDLSFVWHGRYGVVPAWPDNRWRHLW